jgi:hypothetical protein
MMFGMRYRVWRRTGVLAPVPTAAIWFMFATVAFLALVWWFSR